MRTMFTVQGAGSRPIFMGQASGTDQISEAERNKLLNDLADAGDKLTAINAWIQSHPNAQAALGSDYQQYQDASSNMSHFGATAATVQQKLASMDPSIWVVSAQEWNDTTSWITFVGMIYAIVQRHGATAAVPTTGVKPGTPAAAAAATSTRLSTGLLVGGGVAAALIIGALLLKA